MPAFPAKPYLDHLRQRSQDHAEQARVGAEAGLTRQSERHTQICLLLFEVSREIRHLSAEDAEAHLQERRYTWGRRYGQVYEQAAEALAQVLQQTAS